MVSLQAPKSAWQMRVFPWLIGLGWVLVGAALLIGALLLAPTAANYWGAHAKAARDGATVGSALLGQLESLTTVPRWLEPLTFLGVAAFMLGIALEFSSVPQLLRNRGEVMRACFPLVVENPN